MSSSEVKVGAFALGGAVVLAGIITFMGWKEEENA